MYDELNKVEQEKTAQWNERAQEQARREKSILFFTRSVFVVLFLLLVSFTVASMWQARLREKQYELIKRSFEFSSLSDFSDGPLFSISTTTKENLKNVVKYEIASWYDYDLPDHKDYSKLNYTAASRDYSKGTKLIVCVRPVSAELKCVQVRVNDYGPDATVHPDRAIDLSSAAFKELAPLSQGLVDVQIFEKLHVGVDYLNFLKIENDELNVDKKDEGSKIDESKNEVFIRPIYKPAEI